MFTDPQFFFWKNRNLKNSLNRKANIHVSVKFNRSLLLYEYEVSRKRNKNPLDKRKGDEGFGKFIYEL